MAQTAGLTRRQLLRAGMVLSGAAGFAGLLSACSAGPAAPASSGGAPASTAPTSAPATSAPAKPAAATQAPAVATQAPAAASGKIGTPGGKPEKPSLKVGIPVEATSFLPVYLGADSFWKDQGLTVQLLSFRGDAEVAQALAGDSVDINAASVNGLINMINAGQPVSGFYAGFYQADFSWLALPAIKTWSDLKGKSAGISTYGALTDVLTRYVLKKHGLEPEVDVHMVQAGGTPQAVQAMRAGKLDSGIISPPYKWDLQDEGMTLLGTEVKEVAPQWPKHIYMTKTKFLDENPNTITALLRGHVAAIQAMRKDKSVAVNLMVNRLKYTEANSSRAYDEVMPGFNEKGTLPDAAAMKVFWDITIQTGDVKEAWPDSKLLDRRYVGTYDQWAPKSA